MKYILLSIIGLMLLGGTSNAQKKALTPKDYDLWKRIENPDLSQDGNWVLYRVSSADDFRNQRQEAGVYLYQASNRKTTYLPEAQDASFFCGGKWLSYSVRDTSEGGKDDLFLLRLRDFKKQLWNRAGAFQSVYGTDLVTYSYEVKVNPADTSTDAPGFNRLVIWNFTTGDSLRLDSIENHSFYNQHKSIAFLKREGDKNVLYAGTLGGTYRKIYAAPRKQFRHFNIGREEKEGTFSLASDSLIYRFSLEDFTAKEVFRRNEIPVPAGFSVRRINLSEDDRFVTYELMPERPRQKPAPKPAKDESFELQLWTWNETVPQSRQEKDGLRERPSYPTYIFHIQEKKNILLAPAHIDRIVKPHAKHYDYVLLTDETPYKAYQDWKEKLNFDVSVVNIHTGETRLLAKEVSESPVWSPDGRYALIYRQALKAWYKFDTQTGEFTDISSAIGFPVYHESHDKPCPARPYGIAGWSEEGNRVMLYDRYDIWVVDLTGTKPPYAFTQGYGRKNDLSIRMLKANFDPETLDLEGENLVETFNLRNKDNGIYLLQANGKMKKLMEGAWRVQVNKISDNRRACIFTRQSYTEFRDLWWSRMDFSRPVRVTEVNPQQKDYNWGTVKLMTWTNYEGKENQGLLYLPEGYDPAKKYPLLVQFYETHTEEMHIYHAPALSSAMADIPTYVSNGYMVFTPDVHFTVGNPGQSCYDAVVSGVQMLIDQGIADKDRIGLQGHSWSGFQTSYLVTKTSLFRCANIGAPIVDMVSGYVGIRNGSGLIRFFMYEDTQSRMGKPLWEDKEGYLRNSPLLNADRITTPLLIYHCDEDEAVAYEQGRALYLAMRRLQRPAWLLNYKGDGHFLFNPAAQLDWTIRMQQFFDYYLKDAPMPRWMKEGINVNERGIDQKYDPVKSL